MLIDLLGTLLRMYTTVFKASRQSDSGKVEWLVILLTISLRVRFIHSATPFILGLLRMVYCRTILCSFRKRAKGLGHCSLDPSYLMLYLPPQSNLTALIFFPSWSSTSALKDLKTSKDWDFSWIKYKYPKRE